MDVQLEERSGVRLAIEGCGHGTLHAIYASVTEACKQKGWPGVDLLIIGGDFQAVRNAYDLNCVNMPAKYRSMCDFHEYYSGQRTAPYLTIFVGGNHEASNYLFELYYGGWVAPNIYYVGAANVLRFGPLRIAALSGIWKGYNYNKPHFERLPYNESDMRSVYHVRELDVRKLLQIRDPIDIGISHDWPKGVEWKGNWKQLFRFKKHLESDARDGQLGSTAAKYVMEWLRPRWWFSAHLHCKYAAVIEHEKQGGVGESLPGPSLGLAAPKNEDEINLEDGNDENDADLAGPSHADEIDLDVDADVDLVPASNGTQGKVSTNADELDLELEDDVNGSAPVAPGQSLDDVQVPIETNGASATTTLSSEDARAALPESFRYEPRPEPAVRPPAITNKTTNFLALDKCLPSHHFLQLLSIPNEDDVQPSPPLKLQYDREWLAITRAFVLDEPLQLGDINARTPRAKAQPEYIDSIAKRKTWIDENISDTQLIVPENFVVTAPVYDGGNWNLPQYSQVPEYPNPQTAQFCELLQVPNAFDISAEEVQSRLATGPRIDPESASFSGEGHRGRGRGRGRGDRGRGRSHGHNNRSRRGRGRGRGS